MLTLHVYLKSREVQGSWCYRQWGQWWKPFDAVTEADQPRDDNLHWTGKSNAHDPCLLGYIWDSAFPQMQGFALPMPSSLPSTDTETPPSLVLISLHVCLPHQEQRVELLLLLFYFKPLVSDIYWILKTGFENNSQKCWAHHKSSD